MAQEPAGVPAANNEETTNQQPPSPTASSSSREGTRDTREKLKKTSLAGLTNKAIDNQPDASTASASSPPLDTAEHTPSDSRGRPAKKRSFEDLAKDEAGTITTVDQQPQPKRNDHKRMRSQEVHQTEYLSVDAARDDNLHEETDIDAQRSPGGPGVLVVAPADEAVDTTTHTIETRNATHPDPGPQIETSTSSKATTKVDPASGFANTSTASPFGGGPTAADKSAEPAKSTSTSAFASSGLAAFASSDKSPFGAAASAKSPLGSGGGFGGPSSGGFGSSKGGFGGAGGFSSAGTSSFGGSSSTFGAPKSFGSTSGFGAPKPFGASSAFGSGGSIFGSGKPFGSTQKAEDDDEEVGNEADEETTNTTKDDAQQDPRFHEQHIETGEDDEETIFTSRARLYFFEGAWKERGTGVLKINVRVSDDAVEDDPEAQTSFRRARLLMRADGTHRVILNSPVFKGMQFGASDGTEPTGKIMHLQSLEEAKAVPLQIKIGKEEVLRDLYTHLKALESELQP